MLKGGYLVLILNDLRRVTYLGFVSEILILLWVLFEILLNSRLGMELVWKYLVFVHCSIFLPKREFQSVDIFVDVFVVVDVDADAVGVDAVDADADADAVDAVGADADAVVSQMIPDLTPPWQGKASHDPDESYHLDDEDFPSQDHPVVQQHLDLEELSKRLFDHLKYQRIL